MYVSLPGLVLGNIQVEIHYTSSVFLQNISFHLDCLEYRLSWKSTPREIQIRI